MELQALPSIRIDKWLWAVRICKTRLIASTLCKRQKVFVDGQLVKPSREVHPGQTIAIKKDGIEWQYKVIQCIEKRVSAPLAALCKEDRTSQESLDQLKMINKGWAARREKGAGRPTKKERRDMDKALERNYSAS